MIKINLLPQKRPKRQAGIAGPPSDGAAAKQFAAGCGALVAGAALVFLLMDMPVRSDRSDYEQKTRQLNAEIEGKKKKLEGFEQLKAENEIANAKLAGITRLIANKVVPANVLHELGQILSTRGPTMTDAMNTPTSSASSGVNVSFASSIANWDATSAY